MLAAIAGGALGPWITGLMRDVTGAYGSAFGLAIGVSGLSAFAIWRAAPGKVRVVGGRLPRVNPSGSA